MSKYIKKIKFSTALLMLVAVGVNNMVQAKTYRWVDQEGKVHYSQSIPPSGSQLGHQELDERNGMTLNSVESSHVRKQRLKEKQLENERNELKKQALREELMIYMFSSKEELIAHYEERLKMISVNIRLLQFHQKKLKNTIKDTGKKIKSVKADKLKSKLETGLRDSQQSLIDHTRAIQINETERSKISAQMARSVKTYNKKFGGSELDVGSLIGSSVLDTFRGKSRSSVSASNKNMCSCPCSVSK